MSRLDNDFATGGVSALMDGLGSAGRLVYTPAGGDAVSLTAMIGAESTEEGSDLEGRTNRAVCEVIISTDPDCDYGGVASPATNATVTLDGVEWAIDDILAQDANLATLRLVRETRVERGRPDYRR